jgi:hypothetical protein
LSTPATYKFDGARFFSNYKKNSTGLDFMYTMSHVYRGFIYDNKKCIHDTTKVLNAEHHKNVGCIDPGICQSYLVNIEDGYFLHYRIGWDIKCRKQKCVKYDPIVLKYKTRLESAMKNVLAHIFN